MAENTECFLCCGRKFRDAHALEQHVRNSPNHQPRTTARDTTGHLNKEPLESYSDLSTPRSTSISCLCGESTSGQRRHGKSSLSSDLRTAEGAETFGNDRVSRVVCLSPLCFRRQY
jgi:hypothetical protein